MPDNLERGALTEAVYYILLSLYRPRHGYAIMQYVAKLTGGRVSLGPGTLYGAINSLIERNWITNVVNTEDGRDARKKEYIATTAGKAAVTREIERLEELIANGKKVTEGDSGAYRNQ